MYSLVKWKCWRRSFTAELHKVCAVWFVRLLITSTHMRCALHDSWRKLPGAVIKLIPANQTSFTLCGLWRKLCKAAWNCINLTSIYFDVRLSQFLLKQAVSHQLFSPHCLLLQSLLFFSSIFILLTRVTLPWMSFTRKPNLSLLS